MIGGEILEKMNDFDFEELEAATENLSPSNLISKGSHGKVYRGILNNGKHLAIKKQSSGLQGSLKIENEARMLSSIHQNSCLVEFLGISHDGSDNKLIVMEHMPNGTLHELLHSPAVPPPTWRKRLDIAVRVAIGVRFLHESNHPLIVHRDIKSTNILLDSRWDAKLADFGLSVFLAGDNSSTLPAGTIGYLDPNYNTPCKLSTKIDVFSHGVVLLELISCREVMDVRKSPASIVDWAVPLIKQGRFLEVCDKRTRLQPHLDHKIKCLLSLATRCVFPVESLRPSMSEIVATLEDPMPEPIRFPLTMINFIRRAIRNTRKRNSSIALIKGTETHNERKRIIAKKLIFMVTTKNIGGERVIKQIISLD
ncbi:serine/threonine-protein kinase-like protein At5g23170 [Primulina tabacum]|uniref:serine/threonine-protein kinase-like protein At5g23170 n=1 Tax=Primulina tabacum TaxID=48773 RepID=UPI003F5A0446